MFWRFFPFAFLFSFITLSVIFLMTKYGNHSIYQIGDVSGEIGFFGVFYYSAFVSLIIALISYFVFIVIFDEKKENSIGDHIFAVVFIGGISGYVLFLSVILENEIFNPIYYYVFSILNISYEYFPQWVIPKFLVIHSLFIFLLTFLTLPVVKLVLWGNAKRVEKKLQKAHQQKQALLQLQKQKQAEEKRLAEQRLKQEQEEKRLKKRKQQAEEKAKEEKRQRITLTQNIQIITQKIDTVTIKNQRLTQEIRNLERIVSGLDIFDDNFLDDYPKVLQYIDEEYEVGRAV